MGDFAAAASLSVGHRVLIVGLKDSSGLNGCVGTILGLNEQFDRWQVLLDDGRGEKLLKHQNLDVIPNSNHADTFEPLPQMTEYFIVGSWTNWAPTRMTWNQSCQCFRYTMQVGRDGWESFQIWLDCDLRRCLHPGRASEVGCHFSESAAHGPDSRGHGLNWTIGLPAFDRAYEGDCYYVNLRFRADGVAQVDWALAEDDFAGSTAGVATGTQHTPARLPETSKQISGARRQAARPATANSASPPSAQASAGSASENLRLFLSECRPDWSDADVSSAVEKLLKVKIDNVIMLVMAVRGKGAWKAGLNAKLEAAGERGFADFMIEQMKTQADVLEKRLKTQQAGKDTPTPTPTPSSASGKRVAASSENAARGKEAGVTSEAVQGARSATKRTSRMQSFRVVPPCVDVHMGPDESSEIISVKPEGELVWAQEETFDRWARLESEAGWIYRGVGELSLSPEGDMPLLAVSAVATAPGPVKFEVAFEPHVPLCSAPERSADVVVGLKNHGDVIFAEAQSYDGWVRLVGGEWVPCMDDEHGVMLCCTGLEEEKARQEQRKEARAVLADATTKLHGNDFNHARAFARFKGWSSRLAELEAEEKLRQEFRLRIREAAGNKLALSECAADATRLGLPDEALLAKAFMAKAADKKVDPSAESRRLLDAITAAAASGDLLAVASARDAAREAGLSKKEISRAFALGNS